MTVLITSAAYVSTELAAEFGRIPPSFLPLGNSWLLASQIKKLQSSPDENIYLSLPESFELKPIDEEMLSSLGLSVIRSPDNLRLGHSILHCLHQIAPSGAIRILHGDTLVDGNIIAQGEDAWAVAMSTAAYPWGMAYCRERAIVGIGVDDFQDDTLPDHVNPRIIVGYFSFSSADGLIHALQYSNGDFLTALARYATERSVAAVEITDWMDCGHLQTYYRARGMYAAARSFNHVNVGNGVVRKTSEQSTKLEAEANWFNTVPPQVKTYTARLIEFGDLPGDQFQYATEYEAYPTLHEFFVFGRLSKRAWLQIFASCFDCLERFAEVKGPGQASSVLQDLGTRKTRDRLDRFESDTGIDLSKPTFLNGRDLPSFREISERMIDILEEPEIRSETIMHGDFCFTNILYNPRSVRIRVIDPRGTINGTDFTVFGDLRYDIAKLLHSVVGRYDLILAGRYHLQNSFGKTLSFDFSLPAPFSNDWMDSYLWSQTVAGQAFDAPKVKALLILLFLSMLPLHSDRLDRQLAFLANVLRLFQDLFGEKK